MPVRGGGVPRPGDEGRYATGRVTMVVARVARRCTRGTGRQRLRAGLGRAGRELDDGGCTRIVAGRGAPARCLLPVRSVVCSGAERLREG